jgi:hypothetical protein
MKMAAAGNRPASRPRLALDRRYMEGGALRGPERRWDTALPIRGEASRVLRLRFDRSSLRADWGRSAKRVLNHTNFASVNTNSSSSAFGHVTTVRDPRQVQLVAKLEF